MERREKLFDRLVAVLGTSEQSIEFKQLLELIGEPTEVLDVPPMHGYHFNKLGIYFLTVEGLFCALGFHFWTRVVRDGAVPPYAGDLIGGILSTDTSREIESKLGIKPSRVYVETEEHFQKECARTPYREFREKVVEYRLGHREIRFTFRLDDERLVSVSVTPANK